MKKSVKILFVFLGVALLFGAGGFIVWAESAARPGEAAQAALRSDGRVTVTDQGDYIAFEPVGAQPETGFIFYPGGRVDYRAYAPVLRLIAAQGYFVALVPVTLNLAFFDIEAGVPVLSAHPEITHWAVGGHSLGGVAGSIFAANHPEIKGVVYWASYPADDTLKDAGLETLSVYGTNDGLATGNAIDEYKLLMPSDSIFVPIEGGNHAQFGDYGPQDGDNPATISPESQWQQVSDVTAAFLASLAR